MLFKLPKCYSSFLYEKLLYTLHQIKKWTNQPFFKVFFFSLFPFFSFLCASIFSVLHFLQPALSSPLLKIRPSRLHFRLSLKKTHLHKLISWPFHQTQPVSRSGLALTAWVSRWKGRQRGSQGGGGDGVDLAVEELRCSMDLAREELTTWVLRWSWRLGSRGGGGDGVDLTVELSGGADGGCIDFDLINNK